MPRMEFCIYYISPVLFLSLNLGFNSLLLFFYFFLSTFLQNVLMHIKLYFCLRVASFSIFLLYLFEFYLHYVTPLEFLVASSRSNSFSRVIIVLAARLLKDVQLCFYKLWHPLLRRCFTSWLLLVCRRYLRRCIMALFTVWFRFFGEYFNIFMIRYSF